MKVQVSGTLPGYKHIVHIDFRLDIHLLYDIN